MNIHPRVGQRLKWQSTLKYALIIVVLCIAVYSNTLHNDFVSDDIPGIVNNPDVTSLFYRLAPPDLTSSICYHLSGLNTFTHHLVSIILHCLTSILVFLFLCLFFKELPSFWAASVFAVHPIHTEAVTWISGRPYIFMAFFILGSFLFYVHATADSQTGPGRRLNLVTRYILPGRVKAVSLVVSLFLYYCAMYSASFSFVYPAMLAIYDFCYKKNWKRNWWLWSLFFALTVFKLLMANALDAFKSRVSQIAMDLGSSPSENLGNPIYNLAYSFFSHLGLLLWPQNLSLYHEPPVISFDGLVIELLLLAILALSMPVIFKKKRILFFAVWIFILFLVPTYSPVVIAWLLAERYIYLPSVSFSILIAYLITSYVKGKKSEIVLGLILIPLLGVYSFRTIVRNLDWKTHASIWRATVKVSPFSYKAHNNMGDVYGREGNFEKAAEEFRRSIELRPTYSEAYHNLGVAYHKLGRVEEALENYQKAVSLNPKLYQSYQNLAYVYFYRGQPELAKECLRKVLEIRPDDKKTKQALDMLESGRAITQ